MPSHLNIIVILCVNISYILFVFQFSFFSKIYWGGGQVPFCPPQRSSCLWMIGIKNGLQVLKVNYSKSGKRKGTNYVQNTGRAFWCVCTYVARNWRVGHLPRSKICLRASVGRTDHQQDTPRSVQAAHLVAASRQRLLRTDQSHPPRSTALGAQPRSASRTAFHNLSVSLTIWQAFMHAVSL